MITRLPNGEELDHDDELDPDLAAALKNWEYEAAWFDIEMAGGIEKWGDCPCCEPDYRDIEEDPYAHWVAAKEAKERQEKYTRATAARDQAFNWFWTLVYERLGKLPSHGAEEIIQQFTTARRLGF